MAIFLLALPLSVTAATWSGRVVGVADGDTITVRRDSDGQQLKVRLAEIDAPERRQAFGAASKKHLSDAVYGREAVLDGDKRDRYGRTLAYVTVDGRDVQRLMLRDGFAWCYVAYAKRPSCETDEAVARSARRGVWQDDHPVPPWKFRRASH